MAITPRVLEEVFHDNQRSAQIGGQTDGITPEVAADLGYTPTQEDLERVISAMEKGELAIGATRAVIPENVRELSRQHRARVKDGQDQTTESGYSVASTRTFDKMAKRYWARQKEGNQAR